MLPQQAVKQLTPGWQRKLILLSKVYFVGMILLGLLSLPNMVDLSVVVMVIPHIKLALPARQSSCKGHGLIVD